ncbi:hypothetical protein C8R43DRAFT_1102293 [Mycena crocata]|nr:hypothetical protein C8R43DRAFT_1102293 [Mycena crocata]
MNDSGRQPRFSIWPLTQMQRVVALSVDSFGDALNFSLSVLSSAMLLVSRRRPAFGRSDPPTKLAKLPSTQLDNTVDWLSFDPSPSLVCLECRFSDPHVLRDLGRLTTIVAKALALKEVTLRFPRDIFASPDPAGNSPHATALAVRDLMCAMAARTDGPVIFLDEKGTMTCFPSELPAWKLHESLRTLRTTPIPFTLSSSRSQMWLEESLKYEPQRMKNHSGRETAALAVANMHTLTMRSLQLSGSLKSCTLINNGADTRTSIWLGESPLTGDELNAILPHIMYPNLTRIYLLDATIDPAILSDFLRRHTELKDFYYIPMQRWSPLTVVDPLVVLPAAGVCLASPQPQHLNRLLTGIANPRELQFEFTRDTPGRRAALRSTLRQIAQYRHDIYLHLSLASGGSYVPRRFSAEEISIARSLHCVRCVGVALSNLPMARTILDWLAELPALREVVFALRTAPNRTPIEESKLNALCMEIASALPGVRRIEYREPHRTEPQSIQLPNTTS